MQIPIRAWQSGFLPTTLVFALALLSSASFGEQPRSLTEALTPFVDVIVGKQKSAHLTSEINVKIDGRPQSIKVVFVRNGAEFDITIEHADYSASIRRREEGIAFALPKHRVVFLGKGELTTSDRLELQGLSTRLLSPRTSIGLYCNLALQADAEGLVALGRSLLGLKIDDEQTTAKAGDITLSVVDDRLNLVSHETNVIAEVSTDVVAMVELENWPGYTVQVINRDELETTLVRGVRRAIEILAPGEVLRKPRQQNRQTEHGELRWIEGQRVVLLRGTPEQVGQAHGELLKEEANTCIDSVLYTFGTANTIMTGKWFRSELEQAFVQLEPFIPDRFRRENRSLAQAIGRPAEIVDALNVFPEMFHCSGFAVFGAATVDGKLYHGRVLDYMTTIGLQDAATNFVISAEDKIPFVNVGYAGFTGSVSGMNDAQISLGEMGGRGEGRWNGVPMATMMRMALEDCSSLDQVKKLWSDSPRTCEYYYVFADGKTNQAVGVAAVPEKVEFLEPGQTDPRLGEGIADAVVLSAGDRLAKLRERVLEKYGKIDAELGMWLMNRPVAMKSNLHNVLFVPADGVLYVANADHKHPAAERPYVKINLRELLGSPIPKLVSGKPEVPTLPQR